MMYSTPQAKRKFLRRTAEMVAGHFPGNSVKITLDLPCGRHFEGEGGALTGEPRRA